MFLPLATDGWKAPGSGPGHPQNVTSSHDHPLNVYGAAILGLIGLYLAFYAWFCRYLGRAHREVWQRLGQPSLIMNNTPVTTSKVLRVTWSAEHNDIGDPKLSAAIYLMRLAQVATVAAIFALVPRA